MKSRVLVRAKVRLTPAPPSSRRYDRARKLKLKRTTVTATLEVTIGKTKLTKKVVLRR